MFKDTPAFASISVNDIAAAHAFYGDTLGLPVQEYYGQLRVGLAQGGMLYIYAKPDHAPATFTVLNFRVPDIEAAITALAARGVRIDHYPELNTDALGVLRSPRGPYAAWFKDPAGNILSLLQDIEAP
jgi:predicted enzyme related to lactoylglutathione lyase